LRSAQLQQIIEPQITTMRTLTRTMVVIHEVDREEELLSPLAEKN
jgi:hypothetical protein